MKKMLRLSLSQSLKTRRNRFRHNVRVHLAKKTQLTKKDLLALLDTVLLLLQKHVNSFFY